MAILNHVLYLLLSLAFTVYVGQSLYSHGLPFLVECWGDLKTAESVNRLFLAGFYLMNVGFIALILRFGETGDTFERTLEVLTSRVGFVALVMGCMHFNNLFWCEIARRWRDGKHRNAEIMA